MKDIKIKQNYNMWQNSTWMIILAWRNKEKKVIILSVLWAFAATVMNVLNLYTVPTILADVEKRVPIGELAETILFFVIALMVCSGVSAYINTNLFPGRITIRSAILSMLTHKDVTTSYPNLDNNTYTKLVAKAIDTVKGDNSSTQAIWTTLSTLLLNCTGFIIYVLLLTEVHVSLCIMIIITSIISYIATQKASNYQYIHREEAAEYNKKLQYIADMSQDTTIAKDVRIFGLCTWLEELTQKTLDTYEAFQDKVQMKLFWAKVVDLILVFFRNGIAYAYLIYLVLSNSLSASAFLLYFSAVSSFALWVTGIIDTLSELHRQSIDISAVREVLEFPEPFKFENGKSLNIDSIKGCELKVENVSFRYPGAEKYTLQHINLILHPGENIAIVGLNGAGKTTLVKLICGFLDPTSGRILLDGIDIRDYNRRDYYRIFSVVFQNFMILPETIAANVAQSIDNINLERVKACLEKAGLKEKVESLSNNYETLLDRKVHKDAIMLSGGETQRLMLARALYKDVPFVILDEPTAALDPIAESDMYQKYSEMTKEKTSVYISHRLASTRFCDRILLIEEGKIIEEGTHETLIAQGKRYAELFFIQSKYYQEGGEADE